MADMFKVSTSEDHVTFSVWPENADTYHDIMKMHVDGHFRPPPEKTWDYAFHCDWWDRLDLFKPRWISTEERIVELSIDRKAASRGSSKMLHETLVQKSRASVVASRASEPYVINTGKSTMHGGGGLLETVHMAYNFDKDLIITPDDVFLTILAGVNAHIAKDPEKCRHALVNFEGKKDILIECNYPPDQWEEHGVFDQFSRRIRDEVGDKWHDATLCDFSTTTPLEKLISQLGLMESTNHYFDFRVAGMCGIKAITLKGTVEDWLKLRKQIEAFSILDLEWWLQDLRLVLDQFVLARQGVVSPSFWRRMIKGEHSDTGVYEPTAHKGFVTGWLLALFPYTKTGKKVCALMGTFSEAKKSDRVLAEYGVCVECGRKQIAGESGCGKFYCADCWQAYDLMKHWSNVRVEQVDLHDGLASAQITWERMGKTEDIKIYGGLVGPSVPADKYAALQTVRGFAIELCSREEDMSTHTTASDASIAKAAWLAQLPNAWGSIGGAVNDESKCQSRAFHDDMPCAGCLFFSSKALVEGGRKYCSVCLEQEAQKAAKDCKDIDSSPSWLPELE